MKINIPKLWVSEAFLEFVWREYYLISFETRCKPFNAQDIITAWIGSVSNCIWVSPKMSVFSTYNRKRGHNNQHGHIREVSTLENAFSGIFPKYKQNYCMFLIYVIYIMSLFVIDNFFTNINRIRYFSEMTSRVRSFIDMENNTD